METPSWNDLAAMWDELEPDVLDVQRRALELDDLHVNAEVETLRRRARLVRGALATAGARIEKESDDA